MLGWILISTGYFVVNHTQTMKLLGARSLWDLQMSVVVGVGLIMFSGYFSSTLGIFGRALMPNLEQTDLIYPRLADRYLASGVKGLVVAGVLASSVSTLRGSARHSPRCSRATSTRVYWFKMPLIGTT